MCQEVGGTEPLQDSIFIHRPVQAHDTALLQTEKTFFSSGVQVQNDNILSNTLFISLMAH